MGGQTALNTAMALARDGTLERLGVELIGASPAAIDKAEDRELFREAMREIGLDLPKSTVVRSLEQAREALAEIGLPAIIRPSFTLGGTGGGIAYNREEFELIVASGLDASPIGEVLIDQSVLGWKEYEMEVVRDRADNCIIVCSIENVDPMGVHTGDSITVAPALTLTDKEYQRMRDASIAVLREIGVDTGGSNVQFAIDPADGRMVVIEMNPRVSRVERLGLQGHGLPDRQGRGQARRRLHAGRDPERHHRRHAGLVRAHDRLCRHQDPALHLREVPRDRAAAHHRDEVGGRGRWRWAGPSRNRCRRRCAALETGLSGLDEIEVPGLAGSDRPREAILAALARPTPDRLRMIAQAFREGLQPRRDPGRLRLRPVVPGPDPGHRRAPRRRCAEQGLPDDRARPARA